jgi:hypothetical protein
VGIKIFGGWSRAHEQKSLAVIARTQYGDNDIDYRFFQDKSIKHFKSIVLRNSGSDWGYSMFRDGMMSSLVKDFDLEYQAYRPAVLFLNGEYWGIQNIREKVNEHFLEQNRLNPHLKKMVLY